MTRINLVTDPSLRSGTVSAYRPFGGASISYDGEYAFYGVGAMKVVKGESRNSGVRVALPVPVTAGLPYAFSVYVRIPVTIPKAPASVVQLEITWTNSVGTVISQNTSALLEADEDSTWYRVGGVWTAPAGATQARMAVSFPTEGLSTGYTLLDAFLAEQANHIGGYFEQISVDKKMEIVNRALSAVPQVINGVRLGADITLNDLTLNTVDEFGTVWVVTDLKGWWGQTDPALPDIPRGTEEGSYDVQGRATARTLTLSGFFIPADAEGALTASLDRLVAACNLVRTGGWFMANEGPNKAVWVRLASAPDIETVNARGRTEFSVSLRAGDPIKYHWNDADPDGFTVAEYSSTGVSDTITNIGTATVTGVFTFTGPAGAGTYIYDASTDERMVLEKPLRGLGIVASVDAVEATNNVATVYTTAAHHLRVGDEISFAGMVLPFSGVSGTRKLLAVSDVFPYSVSFQFNTDDINKIPSGGQLFLSNNDVLVVDTYNRTVTYNGEETGHRYRLTTLTDWVHFAPGANVLQYFDNATKAPVYRKQLISNVATLTTRDPHYLRVGEPVLVNLPVTRNILKKSLTSNKVTLVTTEPHGYAVGDIVNVESTESAVIVSKSRASNVVTLATETSHGASIGDSITVSLPTSFAIKTKGASSTVVTITSQAAHGFSSGDSVVVALPTTATLAQKEISNNQAILTTSSAHGFVPGDNITVALPTVGSTNTKARSGGQVTLTTSASHDFAVGDIVTVNLPVSSTLSGNRVFSASTNLVTYTTAGAHGFGVGDIINISLTPATVTTTSKVATDTACTLTLGTNHRITTGDIIRVTGETSRFDGTFTVTSSTSTTVSYNKSGAVVASTAGTGSVRNVSVADHYNGVGAVETIPSSTTFTVREWGLSSDATVSASGTVSNVTNETYNGDRVITSIPSSNRLSFNI